MRTFRQHLAEKFDPKSIEGIEEIENITKAFGSFDYSIKKDKSSSKRVVYFLKVEDRPAAKEKVEKSLADAGIRYTEHDNYSGFAGTLISLPDLGKDVYVVYKPQSGGMNETTINSSITELFPVIAYEKNYEPKGIDDFYEFLLKVDIGTVAGVLGSDKKAAKNFIQVAETSSKFKEKMGNAISILNYLHDLSRIKSIDQVYWGYRKKPSGVQDNHAGDIFVKFTDKKMLGVSLKAGGEKTKEPQLNTYVVPVFERMGRKNKLQEMSEYLFNNVYSMIPGFLDKFNKRDYDSGRSRDRKDILKVLENFEKNEPRKYNDLYDQLLGYVQKQLIDLFNEDKDRTLSWIRSDIMKEDNNVPLVVIKATPSGWKEVKDKDELGGLLSLVKVIRAYESTSSKQNFFIDVLTNGNKGVTLAMSIRTNKTGNQHKLGQFLNLAVKYNGLK